MEISFNIWQPLTHPLRNNINKIKWIIQSITIHFEMNILNAKRFEFEFGSTIFVIYQINSIKMYYFLSYHKWCLFDWYETWNKQINDWNKIILNLPTGVICWIGSFILMTIPAGCWRIVCWSDCRITGCCPCMIYLSKLYLEKSANRFFSRRSHSQYCSSNSSFTYSISLSLSLWISSRKKSFLFSLSLVPDAVVLTLM